MAEKQSPEKHLFQLNDQFSGLKMPKSPLKGSPKKSPARRMKTCESVLSSGGGKSKNKDPVKLSFLRKTFEEEKKIHENKIAAIRSATSAEEEVQTDANTYVPSRSDRVDEQTCVLSTGEDVISYFATHGNDTSIKFVHLNRSVVGIAYRPYDLEVVAPEETNAEYFTMSMAGLVHISPNSPAEFIPLSEWMRQSMLFNVISKIRFFKSYLVKKCYDYWKNNIRYRLFCQQRKKLAKGLFLGKTSFCQPLLEIKKIIEDTQAIVIIDLRPQKIYEVETFIDFQTTRRAEATKEFESCIERLQTVLQRVCSDVNSLCKPDDEFQSMLQGHGLMQGPEKNKSIVAAKLEQQEKKRKLKQAEEEASMLADFIRLVDYVSVEHLVQLAIKSTGSFLLELLKSPRKIGLFESTIQFGDGVTIFSPTDEKIHTLVLSMTEAMVNTVNSVSRVLYIRPFTSYLTNVVTDGPHVGSTIRSSEDYTQIITDIKLKIYDDFAEAAESVKVFDNVRPIYEHDQTWNLEEYTARNHTVSSLKADLLQINSWEKELEKMRVGQTIGILHVESRKLKQSLIPMTAAKLESIKGIVKDLARVKCKNQLAEYKQRTQTLMQRPSHLKEFASYVEKVNGLKTQYKNLGKGSGVVDEMYRLLSNYGVRISSEDMVQLDDLRSVQDNYKAETDAAEVYTVERMEEMTEQLDTNISRLSDQLEGIIVQLQGGLFVEDYHFETPDIVLAEVDAIKTKLDQCIELSKQYMDYQTLFTLPESEVDALTATNEAFKLINTLWLSIKDWNGNVDSYLTREFNDLDVEEMSKEVSRLHKEAYTLNKKLASSVTTKFKAKTTEFKAKMPTIMDLGNPSMKERHWEKIFTMLEQPWYSGLSFSLEAIITYKIFDYTSEVSEISGIASGEAQIESSLDSIKKGWDTVEFTCISHREQDTVFILGGLEDILTLLDDNQVTLQTMMGSRYIMGVKEEVEGWNKKFSILSETLDEWVTCQRNWMYLETIFSAEDIQKQLPSESQKFQLVDKGWKNTMMKTKSNPKVLSCVENEGEMLNQFKMSNSLLDEIQKSLEDYLETKRMAFPRFYFLSNDELLEILSQTRDPQAVQPHLGKCFDAIKTIDFGETATSISAMTSGEGEIVSFGERIVQAIGPVESWLLQVEKSMKGSLYDNTKLSLESYPSELEETVTRTKWLFEFPAQVIILIDQVFWTRNLTIALRRIEKGKNKDAVKDFLDFSLRQIDAMVDQVRGELTKNQRLLMGALITVDVHARDVVRSLIANKIGNLNNFEWTRQLRYYWEADIENCVAKQTNTRFVYGYEYLGNSPRLVITPLTDICYMTLTGALHLRLGGAPAGPAGTGKTETTKDLAKALAVQCVVFNCSDGLDFKIMGRFFSGLAQAGAWACFDEFNRIDIEVLSVIAQQILCIQQAILYEVDQFEFEGNLINLNMGFGVFITMNPGYAGRTELPDNLKALFRPVAMMVPDYRLIAEIVLFSEGFANALPLSNKMTQLYSLSSEQLSKQDHYDFGMRAVKSVLVAAGQLKRKEPETHEDLLLIRAMRDSNVPKFLQEDLPLFRGIIADLFPGVDVPFVDYGLLSKAIENQIAKEQLQPVPEFIAKAIQVHETQLVRHGMMLVGETGSGKSTNCKILANALTQLYDEGVKDRDGFYKTVHRLILNPKSISAGHLYGEFNLLTNEWSDGLVPKLVRQCVLDAAETPDIRKWIMFDGPVDAVWIENMNTVLDDNKTLCLANSERIKLPSTLHMMFEVQDLKVASPATVSRCGMVYMEQIHVGTLSLAYTWRSKSLNKLGLSKELCDILVNLIESHVPPALEFVRSSFCNENIASNDANVMQSLLNLLISCLEHEMLDPREELDKLAHMYFAFALTWSIGANVDDASRPRFDAFCQKQLMPVYEKCGGSVENVYNFVVSSKSDDANSGRSASWVSWNSKTPNFEFDSTASYFSMVVPTQDTTRYSYILEKLLLCDFHVMYMGDTGVGKSVVIQSFLSDLATEGKNDNFVSCAIGYSAQTKPENLKEILELKLDKKRKNLLGPPAGKKMICFIDDVNMPELEIYGAQPPNELLRQIIDQGGFYDTSKMFFKQVQDVVFAAACAPPGGGRNELTPRLVRHFHMVWIPNLDKDAMLHIFKSILSGFLDYEVPSLVSMAKPIVEAAVSLYQRVELEMLPTPSKSHYTFNLRDLSKVFQGILMAEKCVLTSETSLIRLWLHEEARVFRDRLVNVDDQLSFNTICRELLSEHLSVQWLASEFDSIIFGDYAAGDQKVYQEVEDFSKLNGLLAEFLDEYNVTFPSQMHLVFFNDAIHHISRICRILRQPRGNALLVGVGGSGRQSLARLACFISGFQCFSIEITRGYGSMEFHEDLKKVLMTAGAENQRVAFLFSDSQIVKESFLEDINNLLNTGEVPNLFQLDELEKIVSMVRPYAEAAGLTGTREEILAYYVMLVRENLHVVLAFSPIGSGFRNRCRMFPSLVNCCTIDWYNAWPEDALFSVASRSFSTKADELGIVSSQVKCLCQMAVTIHRTVETATVAYFNQLSRQCYTTPTSYLELIRLYVDMLANQRQIVKSKEARYRGGLNKLAQTETIVADLKSDLIKLQPVLVRSQEETSKLLIQVAKDQKEADAQQVLVEADVAVANKIAAEVKEIADDCQKDLDLAMPAYFAAIKALDSLKKEDITILKTFANPPRLVGVTINAICLLFGAKQEWNEGKKLLNDMKFLDKLREYDKDNIPPKVIRQLGKNYMSDEEFTPETIGSISTAACSLCMWVRAMYTYDQVAKNIAPKKENLKAAEEKLQQEQDKLAVKQSALNEILSKVRELKQTLEAAQNKKIDLERQTGTTKAQLSRAEQLIDSLGEESIRWNECADTLSSDMINLVGDMILAAGCIAYLGPFTAEFRNNLIQSWVEQCKANSLPVDEKFSLQRILSDPVVVRDWNIQGLPADNFSTENGMFATMGRRWPLMIDPQGQANKWIKNMYSSKAENAVELKIIKLTQKDFLRTLENAIRYGAIVLLENIEEELDPSLEPVLLKQIFKRGGQNLLHLGDADIPYNDNFRFYITTKLSNPHYMPEVCIKVTIINFTVTLRGLEDQLLVDVVRNERPDLEQKKDELTVNIAADEKQLKEIEDKILEMLENSKGNILDDEELISVLAHSKVTSTIVKSRMKEAEVTSNEINLTREGYRCVAVRGSIIYFVIATLALIDPMYQYSLQYYQNLFQMRLQLSEKSDELDCRLKILTNDVTESMYVNICRGLFEKDKIIFSYMMAANILREKGDISAIEWNCYLIGPTPPKDCPAKPSSLTWVEDITWINILGLHQVHENFTGLSESIEHNADLWKSRIAISDKPHLEELPEPWNKKLTPFQKLLLLRSMRSEKTVFSTSHFVKMTMGQFFVESPPFDLEGCYNDSTAQVPLIFVLSPGADINDYLLDLASQKGKDGSSLKIISLGQGQGPIAENLMQNARKNGDWVCLQNCHLAVSWLGRLEQILEQTNQPSNQKDIHYEFRLWLTSMPSNKFPVPILQNGIKITNEPPKGIKANLKRTFLDLKPEDYESCKKSDDFKKLLFALAFYNASCLERRKFGAVGWNIPYEWMNSDLKTGMQQVRLYLEEQDEVPFVTLNVMVADITYGGRITDRWDKRTNSSIMRKLFCPQVLQENYRFTDSEEYYTPPVGSLDQLQSYVGTLPVADTPNLFGLHPNANITFQQKETKSLVDTILLIGGGSGGGGGGGLDNDSIALELATAIENRMPDFFDIKQGSSLSFQTLDDGSMNSFGVFLSQEILRFNGLIKVMKLTLMMLKRAIKGLVVMSGPLEKMYQGFLVQRIPAEWENAGYPCLKPLGPWTEDFFRRIAFMNTWLLQGPPSAYWLPGFFFPQGFMTAVKQTYSRQHKIAIDTLLVGCEVLTIDYDPDVRNEPENGVYIFGLYLEGARFDRTEKLVAESKPGILFDELPMIWLKPMLSTTETPKDVYDCPLYKTSIRAGTLSTTGHSTNFVVSLKLPSKKSSDHWICRGCAMLCMLDL